MALKGSNPVRIIVVYRPFHLQQMVQVFEIFLSEFRNFIEQIITDPGFFIISGRTLISISMIKITRKQQNSLT